MARKGVPQPLTLAESGTLGKETSPRLGDTTQQQQQHHHQQTPSSSAVSATGSGGGSLASGRSTPQASRSPRSPRSPFKIGPQKVESPGEPPRTSSPPTEQPVEAVAISQDQRYQRQKSPDLPPEDHSRVTTSTPVPSQSSDHRGHKHSRNDEDKSSKSSFFFSFGKSSRLSERAISPQLLEPQTEDPSYNEYPSQRKSPTLPGKSEVSLISSTEYETANNNRRSKPNPFTLIGRTRSHKEKEKENHQYFREPVYAPARAGEPDKVYATSAPRTAPIQSQEHTFRDMMVSGPRGHSAERAGGSKHFDGINRNQSLSLKEAGGSLFNGLKESRAAGFLSKKLFGGSKEDKFAPKEPVIDDEHYVLKVINLPLVEQTRLTRISKRLEDSRDKTEFWMPAFPWRAIDYLNYKGSDVEGLYRVPGSGPQIKKWQRKFDEELDVDLFEQPDLYDINIIGSMLKAWLRELPDELFPKAAQERVAKECAGAEKVPELLREELSNLSPFKYYLLFAITCHLSLLLAHSDKNKMDFRNLCICFQPCMKIDAFCFKFLVCDWRDCWKGCKNEAKYIEEEYALFDQPPPRSYRSKRETELREREEKEDRERAIHRDREREQRTQSQIQASYQQQGGQVIPPAHRNGNAQQSPAPPQQVQRLRKKNTAQETTQTAVVDTGSTVSTTITLVSDRDTSHGRGTNHPNQRQLQPGELPALSPIKPLSPMGF
ncbi:rho GTPase activator, variant 2 [Neurospora crassa OR74A]|uniref:Rho GTPase activator, variant 1 n=1 Tax=Neurospora crassa (strain ATCC 24698 / 74-OR23-1A / CBS 708.71 / DSM 1257 / FGSC 987) TaxID=367110 RepID=V5IPV2_NEUCR|nr:rho GTPase activator, variant 1 [Neurospora crassa OR74A]XP_011393310.1 rho GTPase activator, variant 2 [Neurospora crassa OR74A]ESA43755.1 rho GTPase activator, variant 1 [Neurospora crassa OR74A]ESA43756.1 rho GTPase activator, variant 2 [Neurospora crassa OR74A]|eukprot:XP_011393308.1 rho GTPase activator, variant 1 [Neurospora crassa OR74A]